MTMGLPSLGEAVARVLAALPPCRLEEELVPLARAVGRVTSRPIAAACDVPGFPRSAMDGFAVRAADTHGASPSRPRRLRLAGDVRMGGSAEAVVGPGEAVAVATGAMLPVGADAVVMTEDAEAKEDAVTVFRAATPGQHTVARGEDVRAGDGLLPAGHRLRPQDVAALAGQGILQVWCRRRVRAGVLSTGEELVPAEAEPEVGQVRDMDAWSLASALDRDGAEAVSYGIVPDEEETLAAAVGRALGECDLLLTCGGTSVGPRDLVARVAARFGPPGVVVHGIAMRPARPTLVAVLGGVPLVGVPGNPTSALVAYHAVVRPVLDRVAGVKRLLPRPGFPARLGEEVVTSPDLDEFLRVRLDEEGGEWWATPVRGGTMLIRPLVVADGLAFVRRGRRLPPGTTVWVEPV
ncbi:MAG: molybdopterin molybdotransferase MoeA [Clostridia bacterium]|nr:molybdopterin molybdotransferase MoeA [Clostridia bacterium]